MSDFGERVNGKVGSRVRHVNCEAAGSEPCVLESDEYMDYSTQRQVKS